MIRTDPRSQMVDELVKKGRIELWWGGSNIKFVELRDLVTGQRASGRSFVSWHIAHEEAVYKMGRLIAEQAGR